MSAHEEIRLETTSGTVIAYFAPNAETTPTLNNDLFTAQPARGSPSIVRDVQKIGYEITVQGTFEHTDNLPDAHASDLKTVFGQSSVSVQDQINRLVHYVHDPGEGGPFNFYYRGNSYTASTEAGVDYQAGVYPVVNISQVRPPTQGGFERGEYTVQMVVGIPRRS